jgi:hypothetical protein
MLDLDSDPGHLKFHSLRDCPRLCLWPVTEPLSKDPMKFSKERILSRKDKSNGFGYTDLPNIEKINTIDIEHEIDRNSPPFKKAIIESRRLTDSDLSLFQRLKLGLFGQAYVGHRIRTGWEGSLPFFVLRCPIHGLVEDYPHGYGYRLDCPRCQRAEALLIKFAG